MLELAGLAPAPFCGMILSGRTWKKFEYQDSIALSRSTF